MRYGHSPTPDKNVYGGVFINLAPAARWILWGNWSMGVRLKLLVATSSAVALRIGGGGVASADSLDITFESYSPGSINGQNGWAGTLGTPINPAIDQEIVSNTSTSGYPYPSFGAQSWRMSNAYTDFAFGDWPFSPSLHDEAGETNAQNGGVYSGGTRQNHFEVQWDFASQTPGSQQSGLQISTSPDRGDGARMSFIRMRDLSDGLAVEFVDYQDRPPFGSVSNPSAGCGPEDNFVLTTVASELSRTVPHTVKLTMDFVDGPRNDMVKVFVDGQLVHVGTSWEDYYRWCTESGGGVPNDPSADQPRTVDSMIFQARTGGGTAPPGTVAGHGFLFDNLSYASFSTNQCDERHSDGDGDVDSSDGRHGHTTFHKHGCGHQDADSVQHTDADQGRSFQSTSVDAAAFTTAADSRTVVITGTGVDNGLPVTFTMTAVDSDGLLPPGYTLVLSDGYVFTGTMVSGALSVL